MYPKVGIILLNWNSFDHTSNCIQSLNQCDYPNFEIIVVDNGSADGSGEQLKTSFPGITLIASPTNEGFAAGNNRGFEYVIQQQWPYAMMLNNDVFVEPDFLTLLVEYMEAHPNVGATQPKIFFNHDRKKVWNGGSYFLPWLGWSYSKRYLRSAGDLQNQFQQVDWITGCAFLTKTAILQETGLLNEAFFIYYEDADLSFRISSLGHQLVFHPKSIIYHIAGSSNVVKVKSKEGYVKPIVHYLSSRNHIWFLKMWIKWYQWPSTLLILFLYYVSIMFYFAFRWRRGKLLSVIRGIQDGLKGTPNQII
jgi:GT2 family glycosyltransferase